MKKLEKNSVSSFIILSREIARVFNPTKDCEKFLLPICFLLSSIALEGGKMQVVKCKDGPNT